MDELARHYPKADDILTGVLALKTEGCNSTWSLSPGLLLSILACCPVISVAAIQAHTGGSRSIRTCQAYAQLARIASHALAPLIAKELVNVPSWVLTEKAAVGALNGGESINATNKEDDKEGPINATSKEATGGGRDSTSINIIKVLSLKPAAEALLCPTA